MLVAVFCFSVMDAAAKWLSVGYSPAETALFSRMLSPFFALAVAMRQGGLGTLRTQHIGWQFGRAMVNGLTLMSFFGALIYLPLADTVAITFVSPLIMSLLAISLLKERIGPRRWAAIVIGFLGVLVITRPSGTGLGVGALLAMGAAFFDALGINVTRRMSITESSHSMLFWSSLFLLLGFGAAMPFQWVTPHGWDIIAIAILAVVGGGAQFSLAQAFRYGEVSLLAPLEYGALIWATLFGYLFWRQLPTATVAIGVAIIIGSSVYVTYREARSGKQRQGPDRDEI
jgi:drug/metabolite transporter (DMT)-like permease